MANVFKTSEGVLVVLKGKLFDAMKLNVETLRLAIDRYISIKHGKGYSKSHFDKVNTFHELTSDKMTIKVFFKFLRILRIKKVTITMTVTTQFDKLVTVEEDVYLYMDPSKGETDEKDNQQDI